MIVSFFMIGFVLAIVFGITGVKMSGDLILITTAPYRPFYQEMLERVEASGDYDALLNKEIYEWNRLCRFYGYDQYMIEYKKGE